MMGVYIKNMKMPTICCECSIKSWDGEDDVCPFSGISVLSIGRQDDCPLIEVPKHGRLIDADALKETMKIITRTEVQEIVEFDRNAYKVDDAPTIIPAEEGE